MNLKEKIQSFADRFDQDLQAEAAALQNRPMPVITEELFSLFETTGNRLTFERVYFGRRRYLSVFGTLAVLYHRPEDICALESAILSVCEETCWALPAHINRKEDADWTITVDLFAAETAQTLAELDHLLGDRLQQATRDRIRTEVFRRVIDPFASSPVPYRRWEHNYSNWNAVCGGSVGMAVLYLVEDQKTRNTIINRILASLSAYFLKGFGNDGACMEGVGYWTYGFSYYVMFAEALKAATSGAVDLLENEHVRCIAHFQQHCYFAGGRTLSFSDGGRYGVYNMGLTAFLAVRFQSHGISEIQFPDPACAAGLDQMDCCRFPQVLRNLLWTRQLLEEINSGRLIVSEVGSATGTTVFPDAEWIIFRGNHETVLAAKGGNNDEPHNHNDIGSFLYLIGEDEIISDIGRGEYTRDYFSDKRYTIFCNSSASHSVPVVDGRYQVEGKKSACSRFETNSRDCVSMEIADAWQNPHLHCLTRTITFDQETGNVVLSDQFQAEEGLSLTEAFAVVLPVSIQDNTFTIHGKHHVVTAVLTGIQGDITQTTCLHKDGSGQDVPVTMLHANVNAADTFTISFYTKPTPAAPGDRS